MAKKTYKEVGYIAKGNIIDQKDGTKKQMPPSLILSVDFAAPAKTRLNLENKKSKQELLEFLIKNDKISEKGVEGMQKSIEGWPEWKLFNVVLVTEE